MQRCVSGEWRHKEDDISKSFSGVEGGELLIAIPIYQHLPVAFITFNIC